MDEYARRPKMIEGPVRQEWVDRAACLGSDVSMFFPGKGARSGHEAKAVCATCPVREECLQYALANNEEYGIFGGLSPAERRQLPRGRKRRAHAACGTTGGYAAHRRRGEETCQECRDANAAYAQSRKLKETERQRQDRLARKRVAYRQRSKDAA